MSNDACCAEIYSCYEAPETYSPGLEKVSTEPSFKYQGPMQGGALYQSNSNQAEFDLHFSDGAADKGIVLRMQDEFEWSAEARTDLLRFHHRQISVLGRNMDAFVGAGLPARSVVLCQALDMIHPISADSCLEDTFTVDAGLLVCIASTRSVLKEKNFSIAVPTTTSAGRQMEGYTRSDRLFVEITFCAITATKTRIDINYFKQIGQTQRERIQDG